MNIPVTFERLLTRGQIHESDGGVYNPGWSDGKTMLVRREVDYTWRHPSYPTIVDLSTKHAVWLEPEGFRPGARIEDCRALPWRDAMLASHVEYVTGNPSQVRQRLSCIIGNRLVAWDAWDQMPFHTAPVEKNWVLGVQGDELFMVYSLDPFIVCLRVRHKTWELVHKYETGLTKRFGKPLHNSTHLVPFDGGYLGFWHYILDRSYVTGAYWLDAKLHLQKRSPILIDGSWVQDDVYKRGVCYVSSAHIDGDRLRLFYGEGDAHSGVATIGINDLREVLLAPDRRLGIR